MIGVVVGDGWWVWCVMHVMVSHISVVHTHPTPMYGTPPDLTASCRDGDCYMLDNILLSAVKAGCLFFGESVQVAPPSTRASAFI